MTFPRPPRTIRAVGFDDAPSGHLASRQVRVSGAVCAGIRESTRWDALRGLTDRGKVPEALRLAHLIGAAVMHGESGRRA